MRIFIRSGRLVNPFEIEQYEFTIEELVHPISQLVRYTGHGAFPYSVAEHTYHLIQHVPDHLKRAAALHDLNEGLTNDLPYPFKKVITQFTEFEERVQRHIFKLFDEPWEHMEELAPYDRRICQDEMDQLFEGRFDLGLEPLGVEIHGWTWHVARDRLLEACYEIGLA